MDVSNMLGMAISLAGTTETDYPKSKVLPFLNLVKDDFFAYLITGAGEDWNWDTWTTTSVVGQSEYSLPEAASDTEGNLKINSISVNYDGDTYGDGTLKFIKAKLVTPSSLKQHWNYYKNNQDKSNPIYYVADNSVFIAPAPKTGQVGVDRIEVRGIKSLIDYIESTLETEVGFPIYLHKDLIQGVLPYIHKSQGRKDEASFETKQYMIDRESAVKKFSNRNKTPIYMSYPDSNSDTSDIYTLNLN